MKSPKKTLFIVILCLIFTIIYTFFAARPLNDKLKISTVWTISVPDPVDEQYAAFYSNADYYSAAVPDSDSEAEDESHKLIRFMLKDRLGYFTEDGTIQRVTYYTENATISSEYSATYTDNADDIAFFKTDGSIAGVIESPGFPFFTEDGNFVFLPGGTGFAAMDLLGRTDWVYQSNSPVTAFSASKSGTAAGFADGKIVCLDKSGKQLFEVSPEGSNYRVILGADLSDSGELLGCVSGIDRQRFVLYRYAQNQVKVVFHEYLENEMREQTFVQFNKEGNRIFYGRSDGLAIVNCSSLTSKHVPLKGKVYSLKEFPDLDMYVVLTKTDGRYFVYLFEGESTLTGSFSFEANNAFILTEDNDLYVGRNNQISKLELTK